MASTIAKDDNLTNKSNPTQDKLYNAVDQAGRKARTMANEVSEEIAQVSDKVTKEIQANPVRSSMIALGVGLLLGKLLSR